MAHHMLSFCMLIMWHASWIVVYYVVMPMYDDSYVVWNMIVVASINITRINPNVDFEPSWVEMSI